MNDMKSSPWKMLFSGSEDITDSWGKLHFGVTPVRLIRECEDPGFTVVGCFPLPDGRWRVFGQQMTTITPGDEWRRITVWKLLQAVTSDGETFEDVETVFESQPDVWTFHCVVAYNPEAQEYLLLKIKVDDYGFGYRAFFSSDGMQWNEHSGNPLFYEGDAMSLFWSSVLRRFVCVSKSLQSYHKHVIDHGVPAASHDDASLRDRRVLMIRSSSDGRVWEPDVSVADQWNRGGQKKAIPDGFLTVPDADDPPDLELYSGNGFWYHDRAYMMVLNYAASPLLPLKHGPHLDNEWWTSSDGLVWERPARGVNALETFPQIPRLETPPMILNGMLLFRRGQMLMGMPEDRLSYVGARSNAEFSTQLFRIPAADLFLNASAPAPDRPFAAEQTYVMVAVVDEKGQPIQGFEAEKCLIRNEDRCDIELKWGDLSARRLAGQTVRLRFFLRSANVYAVTAGSPGG